MLIFDPQGNQLRRDLNLIVGQGKNWKIPTFLPFLLRYISGPVLAIIFSFAFPEFHSLRYDPMMITGFIIAFLGLTAVLFGLIMPRYYDVFIPPHRRDEGTEPTIANEPKGEIQARVVEDQIREENDGIVDGGESGGSLDGKREEKL